MTTSDKQHNQANSGAGFPGSGAFGRFAAAVRRRMHVARCERRLRELPDHMLKDMGLHRSEIPAIARFGRTEYGG